MRAALETDEDDFESVEVDFEEDDDTPPFYKIVDTRHTFDGEKLTNEKIFGRLFKDYTRDHPASVMFCTVVIIGFILACIFVPDLATFFIRAGVYTIGIFAVSFGFVLGLMWIHQWLEDWGSK